MSEEYPIASINGQLVAEVKYWKAAAERLEQQLGAEREKVQDLLKHHARTSPVESQILVIEDLQRQLAAEREKVEKLEEELNEAVKLLKLEDIDAAIRKVSK